MIPNRCRRGITLLWPLLVLCALWISGCGRSPDRESLPRMDRRDLVADVDLVVRCSDTAAFASAMGQSPLGLLWNSPEMAAFRDGRALEDVFGRALLEEIDNEQAARIRDITLEQIKMLRGEVVLGFDFGDFDRQPAITLAAAIRAVDYRRSLEMDALLFTLEDVETITASEDFRGTPITTYLRKEADGDRFLYQAFHDGTLLASEDRAWLEQTLIRLIATPAREPAGEAVLTVSGKTRLMDRVQAFLAEKASERPSPVDVPTVIHSLGIDTVGDVELEIRLREDRADMIFRAARRGAWDRGLMVLIPAEPAPADFRLAHVPRDVAGYQVFRLDLNALWTQIPDILRQIAPEVQMQFNMGVNAFGGLMNIDVDTELFGNLDRLAYTYVRLGDEGQEMVYGFRVKDAAAMERTLGKLFAEHSPVLAQLGQFYRRTDVDGHIVHMLQFPMPTGRGDEVAVREIGMTVVDRAWVIGQGRLLVDHVQAAVHHEGEPAFYASPMFTAMVDRLPADACSYGVSDFAAYARFFMDEARSGLTAAQEVLVTPAGNGSQGATQALNPLADALAGFDIAKLPSADSVARYFATGDGYSAIDEDGFRSVLTVYYPRR